jgi:hypothetical protein
MIIMVDSRIMRAVYDATRILQTDNADEGPSIVALQLESISFKPDTVASSFAVRALISACGMMITLGLILF